MIVSDRNADVVVKVESNGNREHQIESNFIGCVPTEGSTFTLVYENGLVEMLVESVSFSTHKKRIQAIVTGAVSPENFNKLLKSEGWDWPPLQTD